MQSDENRIPTTSTDYASHLKRFFIRWMNANSTKLKTPILQVRASLSQQVTKFPFTTNTLVSWILAPSDSVVTQTVSWASTQPSWLRRKPKCTLFFSASAPITLCYDICWEPQSLCIQPARSWPSYLLRSSARCRVGTCSSLRKQHTWNCRQPSQEGSRSEWSQGDPSAPGSPIFTSKTTKGITKRMRDTLLDLKYLNATSVPQTLALLSPWWGWWASSL